ncbi:hypothetical protein MRB53_034965, partial [Persea americana]
KENEVDETGNNFEAAFGNHDGSSGKPSMRFMLEAIFLDGDTACRNAVDIGCP